MNFNKDIVSDAQKNFLLEQYSAWSILKEVDDFLNKAAS
jgi:hypothetical protein